MTMSVEDIRGKFTIKTIPAVIGSPTYKAINEVLEALYANAAAIPTTLGGGGFPYWPNHRLSSVL